MSFFFGSGGSKVKPQYTGLAIQTSASSICIPLCYGKNRIAPNIIWQGDFKAHKQQQKAGKGGGSVTTYTYSGSYQLALCWGEINDVTKMWKDQEKKNGHPGFSLFTGTNPQAPWGYLTVKHPSKALGYPDIAYLAVANYDLGQTNTLGQHSFEVEAILYNTSVGGTVQDADPALVIEDFLSDPTHGVGFDMDTIDSDSLFSGPLATTTGDSSFQTYCRAMGFGLSPAMQSQQRSGEIIDRWTMLCNTAIVWTGYSLKFHPYGPDAITAHGVTYLPDFPVRYQLNDDDYQERGDEDPITFNRSDPADAFNSLSLVIANRNNEYNDLPVPWRDLGLVDQFGLREDENIDSKDVTDPLMAAIMVGLMGQRRAYVRNTFDFKLGPQYCRLEPMDVLECYDKRFGSFFVLIKEVNEDDDDKLDIVAEEYPASISSTPTRSVEEVVNEPVNTAVDPGPVNPPIIFEPPSSLTGRPQVWVAVSGGDGTTAEPNWGGCFVWISTDDITYNNIGDIDTPARMGILSAILATYGGVNPDTVDTLSVDLSMSAGELSDAASSADAAAGVTSSYVDGEILSYETTTLTGTDQYDLDTLYRRLYGTAVGSHAIGSDFARLDDAIFKHDLLEDYIGVTLYLKFQSYNIFGGGVQDLADCVAYTYTPLGTGFGGGGSGVPSTPTGLSGSVGSTFAKLTWDPNDPNDNVLGYQVWRATGSAQPFGSATLIGTTTNVGLEYTDSAVVGAQVYTYFLVAVNSVGSSGNTAGIDLTPTAGGGGGEVTADLVCSENLADNDLVHVWDDSGTPKVKKAKGVIGFEAHGFVTAAATSGDTVTVHFEGMMTGLSGMTPGPVFLSTTPGLMTATPPTGSGNAVQRVGVASSATEMEFEPDILVGLWS